jgi:hypothetical protein
LTDRSPFDASTLKNLANYVLKLKTTAASNAGTADGDAPASKKRKLGGDSADIGGSVLFTLPDTSFSIPVRKKLRLEGLNGGLRGLDAGGNIEASLSWDAVGECSAPYPLGLLLEDNR